jgi:hypothetical protein
LQKTGEWCKQGNRPQKYQGFRRHDKVISRIVSGDQIFVGDYTSRVWFNDDSEQMINFKPVLYGTMWGPLRDLDFFNQVQLDPESETLVWPNEADFDPETLRNWHLYKDRLAERAQSWEKTTAVVS